MATISPHDIAAIYGTIVARDKSSQNCTKETCPASDSIYGYAPSLSASVAFLILFFASAGAYTMQGWLYRKSWLSFSIVFALGTVLEGAGYIGRVMLHNDPFSDTGFKLSVVLLTFAPAFMTAGIYLLLKHACLVFSPALSRLQPRFYTWIFVTCDIISMLLQAAGGAISAIATTRSLLNVGVNTMIAGLAFQVFTLLIFGLLAGEYWLRLHKHKHTLSSDSLGLLNGNRKFKWFLIAATVAYFTIFIRCCYRVAELSGGWGNPIMRNEAEFDVLDPIMVIVAAVVLNVFHPGVCFPKPPTAFQRAEKHEMQYSPEQQSSGIRQDI